MSTSTECPESLKPHLEKVDDYVNKLIAAAKGGAEDGWEYVSNIDGIDISRMFIEGNPIARVKGIGLMKTTIADAYEVLRIIPNMKLWDQMFMGSTDAYFDQDITDNVCLGFYNIQFASPGGGWVVAHRDFSVLGLIKKLDDGSMVALTTSVDYPGCPEKEGFVRAELTSSGSWIVPVDENTVKVHYVVQLDPKGWIPTWIVTMVGESQPMNVVAMRNYFENVRPKEKSTVQPDLATTN